MTDLRLQPLGDFEAALQIRDRLPLDRNPAAVYLASLSTERSRAVTRQALRSITALITGADARTADYLVLNWSALRYQHTAALRSLLAEKYRPATANRLLSALRGVLKECWRLGYLSAEDYNRAVDVRIVKGETIPAGRELTQGELLSLVETCKRDKSPAGVRDAAILGLLYTCGLRRAELIALDVEDVDLDTGRLHVRVGKGRKERTSYAAGGALQALLGWLTVSGIRSGALFLPVNKGGKIGAQRITAQSLYDMLRKRAQEAGVKDFSPHDLRRTFVGDMLERGVDIATVAKIAGHASVDTTKRYDRRPEETKRKAAGKLHFPY
jgi:integrase